MEMCELMTGIEEDHVQVVIDLLHHACGPAENSRLGHHLCGGYALFQADINYATFLFAICPHSGMASFLDVYMGRRMGAPARYEDQT